MATCASSYTGANNPTISGGMTIASGNLQISAGSETINNGNLDIGTAGNGLRVAEGANAKQGTATLAAGTVVVANTSVTANSRILCGLVSLGTVTTPSALGVSAAPRERRSRSLPVRPLTRRWSGTRYSSQANG